MHAAIPRVLEQGTEEPNCQLQPQRRQLVGREAKSGGVCQRIRRGDGGRSGMDNNTGAQWGRLA